MASRGLSARPVEGGGLTDSTRLLRAANAELAAKHGDDSRIRADLGAALDLADMAAFPIVRLECLGDVIGGSAYFGQCPDCGRQHMSTRDRVLVRGHQCVCERCAALPVRRAS